MLHFLADSVSVYNYTMLCVFAVALKFGVGVALVLVAHVVLVRKWNAGRYSLSLCLAHSLALSAWLALCNTY